MHQWITFFKSIRWKPQETMSTNEFHILKSSKFHIVLLFLLSMSIWIPNDNRAGKNRQRNINYESKEEKNVFNEIRTLESNMLRSQSHFTFFTECQRKGLHPTNLDYNGNFNVAFTDDSISSKLKQIDDKNITDKISLCVNHFNLQTNRLKEEISASRSRLRLITNEERYRLLSDKLEQFAKKKKKDLAKKKEKKLNKLQWTSESITPTQTTETDWIPSLNLKTKDRKDIMKGE